jgi:uncharacterized protein (TIGR03435 family)
MSTRRRRHLSWAVILLTASPAAIAQTADHPVFDVASVKPNVSGAAGGSVRIHPGGRLVAQNAPLRLLIGAAYDVRDFQLFGGPGWVNSEHYDIEAKAQNDAPAEEMISQMLRSLLADRFHLIVHRETRELPVYRLSVAKGGNKLQPAIGGGCTPMIPPPNPTQIDPATFRPCGGFNTTTGMMRGGSVAMARFAIALSRILGRTVTDETGLGGSYDVNLRWTPDETQALQTPQPVVDSTAPSLFTAIQEQLGLRLESGKGPVEVLVIDQAEKPLGN